MINPPTFSTVAYALVKRSLPVISIDVGAKFTPLFINNTDVAIVTIFVLVLVIILVSRLFNDVILLLLAFRASVIGLLTPDVDGCLHTNLCVLGSAGLNAGSLVNI